MESLDNKNDIAFIDSHCHLQDYHFKQMKT